MILSLAGWLIYRVLVHKAYAKLAVSHRASLSLLTFPPPSPTLQHQLSVTIAYLLYHMDMAP